MASGLLNTAMSIGSILGPIIGGVVNDKVGFRKTCDILAGCACIFTLFFFCSIIIPNIIMRKRQPVIAIDTLDIVIDSSDMKEPRFESSEDILDFKKPVVNVNRNKLNL